MRVRLVYRRWGRSPPRWVLEQIDTGAAIPFGSEGEARGFATEQGWVIADYQPSPD